MTGKAKTHFCQFAIFFVFLLFFVIVSTSWAYTSKVPRTEKKYHFHLHPLTTSRDDDDEQPTLVSLSETTTLWLPRGSTEDNDEHLTFNEDLDPFWVYILRRRRFESIEWSGCGGMWRPEWRSALYRTNSSISESTRELIYTLSHHTVCYFSALSACGWNVLGTAINDSVNDTLGSSNVGAHRHHQWLAQFVSSMLSSPLSWSKQTPRHLRPVGFLKKVSGESNVTHRGGGERDHWCSFHLAQRDTVCTQHVAALLRGGRNKKSQEESIPEGIFRAGLVTVEQFFSSCFHHFHFSISQSPQSTENNTEEVKINLLVRMAFVAQEKDFDELKEHWKRHLPVYANRLTFFAPPNIDARLSDTMHFVMSGKNSPNVSNDNTNLADRQVISAVELAPKGGYYLSLVGHDRGIYRLIVHLPDVATTPGCEGDQGNVTWRGLKVGDVLESLLIFPLHVIRPSLHEMRSDVNDSSVLENAFFDESSNVIVVLLKTFVTEAHLRKLYEVNKGFEHHGFVICEFPFKFGWAALKDMPFDANSYRILPQPTIRVTRHVLTPESVKTSDDSVPVTTVQNRSCASSPCSSFSSMRIDHQDSLERLLNSFLRKNVYEETVSPCVCYYWIRCTNVAGTTIPVPDPAMVFNVISLGLVFSGILTAGMARATRRLLGLEYWK